MMRDGVTTKIAATPMSPLFSILAGIVMHGPGLKVKLTYEDPLQYLKSLFGASIEGVFLLLLMTAILQTSCSVYRHLNDRGYGHLISKAFVLVTTLVGSGFALITISIIVSDATYRVMSGNVGPSSDQLLAGCESIKSNALSQFQYERFTFVWRFVFGALCTVASVWLHLRPPRKVHEPVSCQSSVRVRQNEAYFSATNKKSLHILLILGSITLIANEEGWYTPIIFAYVSIFSPDTSLIEASEAKEEMPSMQRLKSTAVSRAPNIIFISHESLSGSIMNTEQGREAMPFFEKLLADDDMYLFEHARAPSGNTIDAIPALMTGCLPYSSEGMDFVNSKGRAVGYDFFKAGYATASFSSRALDKGIVSGYWKMLHDVLVGGMEQVHDPLSMKLPKDNGEGCDDRRMLTLLETFLHGVDTNRTGTPFYAQFYQFNQHFPCIKDASLGGLESEHRYISSLRTTDDFFNKLFDLLNRTSHLENTIILGSGDHGDDSFKKHFNRLSALSSNILVPAQYFYYPKHLMRDPRTADRLRRNTQQLTSTVDLVATIRFPSFLHECDQVRI